MHSIRFRLGLYSRPHWGAYSALRPSSWITGPEEERLEGRAREGQRKGKLGEGRGEEGKEG